MTMTTMRITSQCDVPMQNEQVAYVTMHEIREVWRDKDKRFGYKQRLLQPPIETRNVDAAANNAQRRQR